MTIGFRLMFCFHSPFVCFFGLFFIALGTIWCGLGKDCDFCLIHASIKHPQVASLSQS